jgi:hypothetical protein
MPKKISNHESEVIEYEVFILFHEEEWQGNKRVFVSESCKAGKKKEQSMVCLLNTNATWTVGGSHC